MLYFISYDACHLSKWTVDLEGIAPINVCAEDINVFKLMLSRRESHVYPYMFYGEEKSLLST